GKMLGIEVDPSVIAETAVKQTVDDLRNVMKQVVVQRFDPNALVTFGANPEPGPRRFHVGEYGDPKAYYTVGKAELLENEAAVIDLRQKLSRFSHELISHWTTDDIQSLRDMLVHLADDIGTANKKARTSWFRQVVEQIETDIRASADGFVI